MSENAEIVLPRAGFWRRLTALFIDVLVVTLPLQMVVMALFAQTNGVVQGSFGVTFTNCIPVSQLPAGLQPPPPAGYNLITECRTSFFGFDMSNILKVGKVTKDGSTTTAIFQDYSLGADGRPIEAFRTEWIALLIFFIYLIAMEYRSGATVGKRALGIRTVDANVPLRIGIPLRKAVLRQLAMLIGLIPMVGLLIVVLALVYFGNANLADIMVNQTYFICLIIAALLEFIWLIWIVISVSRKRDPIYDRFAGTAVLRTS